MGRGLVTATTAGACLLLVATAHVRSQPHPTAATDVASRAAAATLRAFGAGIEVAAQHRPYYVTGDFNGDRFKDLAVMVRLKAPSGGLTKGATLLDPWSKRPAASGGPGGLALAILHGGAKGWEGPPLGRYLLTDRDFFASPMWQAPAPKDLIGVVKKPRSARQVRSRLPRAAKGDAIRVATEAGIDTLLYWDGKTYRLYEPVEEP